MPIVVNKPKWKESGIKSYQARKFNVLSDLLESDQGQHFYQPFQSTAVSWCAYLKMNIA